MTTKPTAKATASLPPKFAELHALLSAASGATVPEIAKAMSLQHHSVRGRLSTARSRFDWQIEKFPDDERGTIYSIIKAAPAPKNPRAAKPKAAAKKTKTAVKRAAAPKVETAVQAAADPEAHPGAMHTSRARSSRLVDTADVSGSCD